MNNYRTDRRKNAGRVGIRKREWKKRKREEDREGVKGRRSLLLATCLTLR